MAYRTILGVDSTPEWLEHEKIETIIKKRHIPTNQAFILDNESYTEALITRAKAQAKELGSDSIITTGDTLALETIKNNLKDDSQPVQIRFFDKTGKPVFKMVNCYVEKLIPMSWNIENCFDEFPPQAISELKGAYQDNLSFFLPHFRRLDGQSITIQELPQSDYYAIIFWNNIMIKPSKKLIKEMEAYSQEFDQHSIHFLYVNNHNAMIWTQLNDEQKEEIRTSGL
ncbi:MAG: hypothetical protein R3B93_26170 [Bacteroidia bacterium]